MKTRSLIKISSLLLLFLVVLAGCDTMDPGVNNTNSNGEDTPPDAPTEPPPAPSILSPEIFSMDFSLFESRAESLSLRSLGDPAYTHFLSAAVRAGAVTVVNATILTPPAVFTGALADAEPVYIEPENESQAPSFVWEKDNVELGTSAHGLRLTAVINQKNTPSDPNNAGIDWALEVTGYNDDMGQPTQDFLMLGVRTNLSTLDGTLELFYPTNGGSTLTMEGDYTIDVDNQFYRLAFTIPDQVRLLGGLETTITQENTLTSLDITGTQGEKHLIQWDLTTGQGSLTASDYNNGQPACWNAELRNVAC